MGNLKGKNIGLQNVFKTYTKTLLHCLTLLAVKVAVIPITQCIFGRIRCHSRHAITLYTVDPLICGAWVVFSKTPVGCLKHQIVPILIYTIVFFPIHTYYMNGKYAGQRDNSCPRWDSAEQSKILSCYSE